MFEIVKERLGFPVLPMEVTNLEEEVLVDAGILEQDKVRSVRINVWQIDRSVRALQ